MDMSTLILPASGPEAGLALHLLLAAVLGAIVGAAPGNMALARQPYALISLVVAAYIAVFLLIGAPADRLSRQLIHGLFIAAPVFGYFLVQMTAEHRTNDAQLLVRIVFAAIVGAAAGLGAAGTAVLVAALSFVILYVLRRFRL